jgi:hypothetical protein
MPEVSPGIAYGRKLLQAVAELHVRGHQKLRIVANVGGPGCWRCVVVPSHYVQQSHGARLSPMAGTATYDVYHGDDENTYGRYAAKYSSSEGESFWQTKGAAYMSPPQLARRFLKLYPELAKLSYGQDWVYAGWYQHMLHATYPDALPIAFNDNSYDDDACPTDHMITIGREVRLPMPPPGHAPE